MENPKILLIGGGGHCKSCIDVIEAESKFQIAGIVDVEDKIGQEILGYKIIGSDNDIPELIKEYKNAIVTIGQIKSSSIRRKLFELLKKEKANIPTIISSKAYVSKHSKIDRGTIIFHGVIVNAGAVIGENCIINSKALIEHDAIIGNHCHISTGSVVNGDVKIGDGVFYGSGAVSKQGIHIPDFSFIKANSIVK